MASTIIRQGWLARLDESYQRTLVCAGAGKIDDACCGRRGEVRANGGDAIAVDEHRPAWMRLTANTVEHARRLQQDRLGDRWRGQHECQ